MPDMNFLSKSRSMAVRLPNGVERLAESRSMLDKKLWELFMVARQEMAVELLSLNQFPASVFS